MPLDPNPSCVIVPVGYKHVSCMRSGNKTQITVVACCNASGSVIPPLVVLIESFLSQNIHMVRYLVLHMLFQIVDG